MVKLVTAARLLAEAADTAPARARPASRRAWVGQPQLLVKGVEQSGVSGLDAHLHLRGAVAFGRGGGRGRLFHTTLPVLAVFLLITIGRQTERIGEQPGGGLPRVTLTFLLEGTAQSSQGRILILYGNSQHVGHVAGVGPRRQGALGQHDLPVLADQAVEPLQALLGGLARAGRRGRNRSRLGTGPTVRRGRRKRWRRPPLGPRRPRRS